MQHGTATKARLHCFVRLICLPLRSILLLRPVSFGKEDDLRSPEVQRKSGSRRVFEQFVWLEVGSVKVALSQPAQPPLTPTVRHTLALILTMRI